MNKYRNLVLEAAEGGMVDKDRLILDLVNYLSEAEVRGFIDQYGYEEILGLDEEDTDENEEEE